MFSGSLNKVWCVNSLINDVKIELTACGCLRSTIACQPPLPSDKLCPCSRPFVSGPISKQNFCGARRQFKCSPCPCSWREELMWNLWGPISAGGKNDPKLGRRALLTRVAPWPLQAVLSLERGLLCSGSTWWCFCFGITRSASQARLKWAQRVLELRYTLTLELFFLKPVI